MKRLFSLLLAITAFVGIGSIGHAAAPHIGSAATRGALEQEGDRELDAGNGISIIIGSGEGDAVRAVSGRSADSLDQDIMACYRVVEGVIHLDTTGLPTGEKIVKLGAEYSGYCVLDDNLSVLGTNRKPLPLLSKYYLVAIEELDWGDRAEIILSALENSQCIERAPGSIMINENPDNGGDGNRECQEPIFRTSERGGNVSPDTD